MTELFPTEDPEYLYVPYSESKSRDTVSARGCMYNYYRLVRKDFREADILTDENSVNEISDQSKRQLFPECLAVRK